MVTLRRRAAVTAACLALLAGAPARAQDEVSDQLWLSLALGRHYGERTYLELDVEPRFQLSGGEDWHSFELTPAVEHYPAGWLDLLGQLHAARTHQGDGLDTLELSPRLGFRLHLFRMAVHGKRLERLPLKRLAVSTLVRLEWRNVFYSDDTEAEHQGRVRVRLEGKLALNHARMAEDGTLYAIGDVEYYAPLGDDLAERFVNKARVRLGLGYRVSAASRIEALYVRDWNRSAPGAEVTENARALDLRLTLRF